MKIEKINRAVAAGLDYLMDQQLKNGGFVSHSSPSLQPFTSKLSYQTTFVPSLILAGLSSSNELKAFKIRVKIADFLLHEMSPNGSFNYWASSTKERVELIYPDDLDDTFCALMALGLHNQQLLGGEILAEAVKLLIATETKPGGPYRTWLIPSGQSNWQDVDVAVNSNVAGFLNIVSQSPPKLNQFLDSAIKHRKLNSPYYPGPVPLIYFLSRAYVGTQTKQLKQLAFRELTRAKTAQDQAIIISSLLRLKTSQSLESKIVRLLRYQTKDGSWPAAAFCIDPEREGQTYYHGGEVLTTALVIEALQLFKKNLVKLTSNNLTPNYQSDVLNQALHDCQTLPQPLKHVVIASLKQLVLSSNGPEIINLPYLFNESLITPIKNTKLLKTLSTANLFGWLAYSYYDDFLDDEGQPETLSLANVGHRKSYSKFLEALPTKSNFAAFVSQTFNVIDNANAWELKHARFQIQKNTIDIKVLPNYGNLSKLAERSLGHCLPITGVLMAAGQTSASLASRKLQAAFRHYLIARQLSDDLHDWEEDVKLGHITYVVAEILKDLKIKPGEHKLNQLIPLMRAVFWQTTFRRINEVMAKHVTSSRRAATVAGALKETNLFTHLADNLKETINESYAKLSQAEGFLSEYQRK